MSRPSVLFVCVHNAARSQMAAAFLARLSQGAVEVRSPGQQAQAMAEVGIDIAAGQPKILTDQAVRESDVVITMGCGDTCPFHPGKRYEDWCSKILAGKGVDAVRPIRDEIRRRVENLIADLASAYKDPEVKSQGLHSAWPGEANGAGGWQVARDSGWLDRNRCWSRRRWPRPISGRYYS